MAESCNLNADYLSQQECLNILEPVSCFSRSVSDCFVFHNFKIFCSLPNLSIFYGFKGCIFLLQMLFTVLSSKAFTAVFLCYLKARLSPIYTGGMNVSIYSTRMAECQRVLPSAWDRAVVCNAQWWAGGQGPFDADTSFSCVNMGFIENQSVDIWL